ncbi:PREDICTED: dromaiocalcin-1-like [Drosophila arizonae]|uniref:Dromaiocalcin-1-like n=1 Tax=Drosophila arizonae TaxID=7263 RepID=A0ABM1PC71_DROAR|nr:PREDICTED: dromaiocalcin-1-like [Drosophila arizonae]
MKSLALCIFWLLSVVAWAESKVVPSDDNDDDAQPILNYFTHSDAEYGISLHKLTWYEAQLYCATQKYVLANIPSYSAQIALTQFIQGSGMNNLMLLTNEPIWVSGTNQGLARQYVWHSSGARFSYDNFLRTPNSANRCVAINGITGDWTDENCRDKHYFVCEKQTCPE